MDDSFKLRVEKIFGSLASSSSSSNQPATSLPSTLWSLTDDAVERREWRRDTCSVSASFDKDEFPCASSFDELKKDWKKKKFGLEDDLNELDDDDDDEELNRACRGGEEGDWDIRSSIGLDRTLDNEEEEDEYDKVAEGRENEGDRLYMKTVTDQGPYLNFYNAVPKSLQGTTRDPRANHRAAKIRLQEDQLEVQKRNATTHNGCDTEIEECQTKASNGQLRSILKRKESTSDFKSRKRVRFDPEVVHKEVLEEIQDIPMGTSSVNDVVSGDDSMSGQNGSGIPDYLRNPSKYTRYSFDSSCEGDEKSNTQACTDFLKLVKCPKRTESGPESEEASSDLPKSVPFIPKKKAVEEKVINDASMVEQDNADDGNQSLLNTGFPVGIAAGEFQVSEVGGVEENESETNVVDRSTSLQKPGRRYREKSSSDEVDVDVC